MARRGLRVVGGRAGGLRLVAPKGARPTADRVKEALFAALGDRVVDAVVLDLYAGSGALAIEALSRGASRAVLVDRDSAAVEVCRRNLVSTRFADRARVVHRTAASFLAGAPVDEAPFDLAFLDPPYDASPIDVLRALDRMAGAGWLAAGAAVVVERATAAPIAPGAEWRSAWERAYGDTLLTILALA